MEQLDKEEQDKDGYLEFEDDEDSVKKKFDFENLINENKVPLTIFLFGLILTGFGVFYLKNGSLTRNNSVEVLSTVSETQESEKKIVVEIAGAVVKPGVYTFENSDARVYDLLEKAEGFSEDVDRDWVDKVVNKAAMLIDGSKYYIRSMEDRQSIDNDKQTDNTSANNFDMYQNGSTVFGSETEGLTNINTSSLEKLEELPGIGPVYGKSIVEHRPYSNIEELVSKGAIKQFVYDKIKDQITVN